MLFPALKCSFQLGIADTSEQQQVGHLPFPDQPSLLDEHATSDSRNELDWPWPSSFSHLECSQTWTDTCLNYLARDNRSVTLRPAGWAPAHLCLRIWLHNEMWFTVPLPAQAPNMRALVWILRWPCSAFLVGNCVMHWPGDEYFKGNHSKDFACTAEVGALGSAQRMGNNSCRLNGLRNPST